MWLKHTRLSISFNPGLIYDFFLMTYFGSKLPKMSLVSGPKRVQKREPQNEGSPLRFN